MAIINFAKLSNEGVTISSSKENRSQVGKKKEILGAGDLAEALEDAQVEKQRLISDKKIEEYVKAFINDDNIIAEGDRMSILSSNSENVNIIGMKYSASNIEFYYSIWLTSFLRDGTAFKTESHYIVALSNEDHSRIECYIDYIPII